MMTKLHSDELQKQKQQQKKEKQAQKTIATPRRTSVIRLLLRTTPIAVLLLLLLLLLLQLESNGVVVVVTGARLRAHARRRDFVEDLVKSNRAVCPFDGSYATLRRFGNRLMYEGAFRTSHACFIKALHLTSTLERGEVAGAATGANSNSTSLLQTLSSAQLHELFPKSGGMPDAAFDNVFNVATLLKKRNRRAYSLEQQLAPYRHGGGV
jgi:hypothetical protein